MKKIGGNFVCQNKFSILQTVYSSAKKCYFQDKNLATSSIVSQANGLQMIIEYYNSEQISF